MRRNFHDVARAHQKRLAYQTLKMSLIGARIMGGMTYAQAYRLIFGIGLAERIADLQTKYPTRPEFLSWELDVYGYTWDDFPALAAEGASEDR